MDMTLLKKTGAFYTDTLLNDVVPFWLKHGLDCEFGGIMTGLDRDGTVIDSDKGTWQQGRFAWLMGHLYNNVEKRPEWLAAAESTIGFIKKYGFDSDDGRMFFHLKREGQPIRKRRYSFAESFACIAMAELAKATGDKELANEAIRLFKNYTTYNRNGVQPPKFTGVRPTRGMGVPMIDIATCQVLRDTIDMPGATEQIDHCINEIETYFVKDDIACVMETVAPNGELIDTFDGRLLNPGHAIEGAWFIMREAKLRGDQRLASLGLRMLDYMWERGWDTEFGGILYFRDVKGLPCHEYWQDMKFWWPHNEAVIATLLAYQLSGDAKYLDWHRQVHDWAFAHFPDPKHGEWFGYLHRDGTVATELKGNLFKGAFHLPRMLIESAKIIGEL